jgi:hypothetical protein
MNYLAFHHYQVKSYLEKEEQLGPKEILVNELHQEVKSYQVYHPDIPVILDLEKLGHLLPEEFQVILD